MDELRDARREFAEALRKSAKIETEALVEAFATVPRELFLGPPPWKIWDPVAAPSFPGERIPYELHHDPRMLCRDVLVAIDADRGINNGQPTLWAFVYDRINAQHGERIVHIGCGVGYYTAILAELVGPTGLVIGLDIDRALLARANASFAGQSNVRIKECDGACYNEGPADIIIVNAGITHPLDIWLDSMGPSGRLMIPLTFDGYREEAGFGGFFLITNKSEGFAARYICPTGILHFAGARDVGASKRLMNAWRKDQAQLLGVSSLRRDRHDEISSCWLHGDGYCLSLAKPGTFH
jgi:protein-L-isoaspartate(D-aspartate) O-methyltransferase